MLIPLLIALQVSAAAPNVASITVRTASASQRVPLVAEAGVPMLRPQALAPLLPISISSDAPGHYRLVVSGVAFAVEVGVASTSVAGQVQPLAAAPIERDHQLLIPLQMVSDVLPTTVNNLRWDAAARQLVIFTRVATPKRPSRLVVVDAGHGGPDNGMTGPLGAPVSIYEKDVTLSVAKKLGVQLKSRGLRVVYTRTTDTLIALSDRGRIANQAGGDLFISVHVNAASMDWKDPAAGRGFETYFLAEARTEDARRVEEMENQSVRFETDAKVSKDDALSYILSDMKQNEHLRESSELAELVQKHLATMHPGPNRGVKQAGFRVLVTAFMPAVLVEIGFGTNKAEAAYLNDPRNQTAIAVAIADAASEYLRDYERRVGGGVGRDER
ncbi:MAG TPA: N-acetylmuramoyl-L-alanine amidase [Gemmatimonadaceae bacterium]|jgi:N-acetylmuramoyl-L-alanine amidase|nr:N-acetylmuramoyl-L-alanine amidase [Gemmatimonadaceae bacterium]